MPLPRAIAICLLLLCGIDTRAQVTDTAAAIPHTVQSAPVRPAASTVDTSRTLRNDSATELPMTVRGTTSPAANADALRRTWVPEWLFWMMLGQLALITFVRVQYRREFGEVFTVFVNNALTQQLYRETQAGGMRMGYFLLNFNFILSLGTWAYLTFKFIGPRIQYPDMQVLPFTVGLVGLLLAARFIALRLATWLLRSSKEIGLFNFTDLQLFRATGLLLFPVNAFLAYAPGPQRVYFLWFSLVVLVTFLLFRVLRGFEIGRTRLSANVFHFLVYICALEIAPVLIGIRLFLNTFGL